MISLSELKSDFIENNFKLDDDGFVRSVRIKNFNGNGLLQPVSFNDLEFVYEAGAHAVMERAEKLLECASRIRNEYKESIYFRHRDFCEKNCGKLPEQHHEFCEIMKQSPCVDKFDEQLTDWANFVKEK